MWPDSHGARVKMQVQAPRLSSLWPDRVAAPLLCVLVGEGRAGGGTLCVHKSGVVREQG